MTCGRKTGPGAVRVAVIGAGAAGCFVAICLKRRMPEAEVDIYEALDRPLAKVAITGGGRCNLTNTFALVDNVAKVYPRGDKLMRRALKVFGNADVMEWFENEGVGLYAQDDQRVFPKSDDAMEIVNALKSCLKDAGVRIHTSYRVKSIMCCATDSSDVIVPELPACRTTETTRSANDAGTQRATRSADAADTQNQPACANASGHANIAESRNTDGYPDAPEFADAADTQNRTAFVNVSEPANIAEVRNSDGYPDAPEFADAVAYPEGQGRFRIDFEDPKQREIEADRVIVTVGGLRSLNLLAKLAVDVIPPVPSLFSFKLGWSGSHHDASATTPKHQDGQCSRQSDVSPACASGFGVRHDVSATGSGSQASTVASRHNHDYYELMGLAVSGVVLTIPGTKFRAEGELLITHWGISGPAVLTLSSYAARYLAEKGYNSDLLINWTGMSQDEVREMIEDAARQSPSKTLANLHITVPTRLLRLMLLKAGLNPEQRIGEVGRKGINCLIEVLTADLCHITGRGQHKEEFVTCGGVSLSAVNLTTLESRSVPGLYFAGEVLDIDAVTGGFNLQAAWSTAMMVAGGLK